MNEAEREQIAELLGDLEVCLQAPECTVAIADEE